MNINGNDSVWQYATTSNFSVDENRRLFQDLESASNASDPDLEMAKYNSKVTADSEEAYRQQKAWAKELSSSSNLNNFSSNQETSKDDDAFLRHSTYDMRPITNSLVNENCFMVQVSSENNNCLIRSILTSLLYLERSPEQIEQAASFLREIYDEEVPNERGKSLYFDNIKSNNGEGGSAASIIKLINTNFDVNISVEVIMPNNCNDDVGHPYITSEAYSDNSPNNNELLKLRIFQDNAHFQSVVRKF